MKSFFKNIISGIKHSDAPPNFAKGIVAGVGGVAPGVSGSVLLMIFGLYKKTIDAVGNLFKNFKENVKFLVPLLAGMGIGVLLFAKILQYLLDVFPMHTRYSFLGMIIGTLPMLYKEMTKDGYKKIYYLVIAVTAGLVLYFVTFNSNPMPEITNPNFVQSMIMGFAIASTAIIPGNDPVALLSTLGMYESYNNALADLDLHILFPFAIGFLVGAIVLTFIMSKLLNHAYVLTFSVIFGLFLSMMPNVIKNDAGSFFAPDIWAIVIAVLGLLFTFYIGDFTANNKRIKALFTKKKQSTTQNENNANE